MGALGRSISAGLIMGGLTVALSIGAAPKSPGKTASIPAPKSTTKVSAPKGCPAGMAAVSSDTGGFCIDKYEASTVEMLPKGKTKAHPYYQSVAGLKVKAVSKKGAFPQAYISQVEAAAACENAGKRLCSDDEWLRACQGKKPTKYPYGDDEVPGRCNGDGTRPSPVAELFGPGPDPYADSAKMNDPRINQLPGTLSKSGSKAKCTNSFGVHDMVGNVHEWTADPNGTFRGGYYMDTHQNGDGCFYVTTAHNASYHDYSTGFRCCK